MTEVTDAPKEKRGGLRKWSIAMAVIAAVVWLASIDKLTPIAAGALAVVCEMFNRANLKAKEKA